jgi:hypothetical protein
MSLRLTSIKVEQRGRQYRGFLKKFVSVQASTGGFRRLARLLKRVYFHRGVMIGIDFSYAIDPGQFSYFWTTLASEVHVCFILI